MSRREALQTLGLAGLGMALLSGLCGLPLGRLQRAPKILGACLLAVGALSVSAGSWWGFTAAERLLR